MSGKQELLIGCITFVSTMISGDFFIDLMVGVIVYSTSRLFYYYYNKRIISIIDKVKTKFSRLKQKINLKLKR
jgi:hypothetical protein